MIGDDNKLGRLSRLLELAKNLPVSRAPSRSNGRLADNAEKPQMEARHDVAELRNRLVARLESIDTENANELDEARQIISREILLWEFGSEFEGTGAFKGILVEVERALGSRSELMDCIRDIVIECKSA